MSHVDNSQQRGILISFHCESNPGFAASSHEHTFLKMATKIVGAIDRVHFAYKTLEGGMTPTLPLELQNVIEFDCKASDPGYLAERGHYIANNNIDTVFGFDLPVRRAAYKYMRKAGVKTIVSYQGAPMSSLNTGLKLLARKAQVLATPHRPDHFIFQSEGMRRTATHGCGIAPRFTSIVRTGIDTKKYSPGQRDRKYPHAVFEIPTERSIVVFAGHMEERKGVRIVLKAARHIVEKLARTDIHFLILGNRDGEAMRFQPVFKGTPAERFITFGGYRDDLPRIYRGCSVGIIASTGWDSFPMSSIEMAASQLPLVVSDLEGLREAISEETGVRFPVGDHIAASRAIIEFIDDPQRCKSFGIAARERAVEQFSVESQVDGLTSIVRDVIARRA